MSELFAKAIEKSMLRRGRATFIFLQWPNQNFEQTEQGFEWGRSCIVHHVHCHPPLCHFATLFGFSLSFVCLRGTVDHIHRVLYPDGRASLRILPR